MSSTSSSRPQPSMTGRRPTVTRILSAASANFLPARSLDQQGVRLRGQPFRLGAGQRLDAERVEPLRDGPRQLGVVLRQDASARLRRWSPRRPSWRRRSPVPGRYSRRRRRPACRAPRSSARASVDEITAPPNGSAGNATGAEPVAITIASARMICVPVSVSTSTVLPSRNLAPAFDDLDLAPLQQTRDAARQPPDDSVLPGDRLRQLDFAGGRAKSRAGFRPPRMREIFANSSAAWISALEGMQPTLRHVPPS